MRTGAWGTGLFALFALVLPLRYPSTALAQTAASASFRLTNQNLNGGFDRSTSATFVLLGCLDPESEAGGESTSASFRVFAGCAAFAAAGVCGNGVVELGEQCDDSNTMNGDCCSSGCQFEASSTICRAAVDVCDQAEQCTGSSGTCPADGVKPAGTSCTADANTCTRDECDGSGSLCTHPPDQSNPVCQPSFTDGAEAGSTEITSRSNPGCTGGMITVYDCGGPDAPPICFNGNDVVLGTAVKDINGNYVVTVPPLQLGQVIYVTDSCTTPPLVGPVVRIIQAAPAPALSPQMRWRCSR